MISTIAKFTTLGLLLSTLPVVAQPSPGAIEQRRAEQMQPRTAITIDPKLFDKYVGFYQMPANLRPSTVITVSRDCDHFFVQLSRSPALEVFAESSSKFFFKAAPAQVSFDLDAQGNATGLVIHQGGQEVPAPRIDEVAAKAIEATPLPHPVGHPAARTWPMMEGIAPVALTHSTVGGIDYWPTFSPAGKTVLFSRTLDGGKSWTLMRVPTSGGEVTAFAKSPLPVSATRADWSAANNLVAFTGTMPDGGNGVWVVKADGTDAHAITATGLSNQVFYPSWYPDGKSMAAMDGPASTVKRLALSGDAALALTDPAKVLAGMPSVSPDGKSIAFAGQKNAGQPYSQNENVIWLADGGNLVTVEKTPLQGRAPVWSPDGKRLAFESDRASPDGRYAIFVVNRDGTGLVQVTDYALNATHPVWSRDGRKMVFAQDTSMKGAATIAITDFPSPP